MQQNTTTLTLLDGAAPIIACATGPIPDFREPGNHKQVIVTTEFHVPFLNEREGSHGRLGDSLLPKARDALPNDLACVRNYE